MNNHWHAQTVYAGRLFQVQVLSGIDEAGRELRKEVVRHPGAVLVIPVLGEQTVVMIRNVRVAVGESLWEFPAGKLEPGEKPELAAGRELEEETGYRCGRLRKIAEFYTSPGFTNELMHTFVAEDLEFVGQRLEPGEEIAVEKVELRNALAMVHDGRLRDGKSIAGLLMWQDLLARTGAMA